MRQAITSRGIFQNSVVKESESIFMPFDNEVFILCVCVCVCLMYYHLIDLNLLKNNFSHLQKFKTRYDFQAFLCSNVRFFNFMFLLHHPIWVEERMF